MNFFRGKRGSRRRALPGFTLAETLTAMAIAAILLGIGVPSIVSYMPRLRLNGASRQLMFDLVEARMQAVKFACNVTVHFERDGSYTVWADRDRDGLTGSDEISSKAISGSYTDVSMKSNEADIRFDSRGASDVNGNIVLYNTKGAKMVSVNTVGRVKIISYTAG